jgi:hypothetical protein
LCWQTNDISKPGGFLIFQKPILDKSDGGSSFSASRCGVDFKASASALFYKFASLFAEDFFRESEKETLYTRGTSSSNSIATSSREGNSAISKFS